MEFTNYIINILNIRRKVSVGFDYQFNTNKRLCDETYLTYICLFTQKIRSNFTNFFRYLVYVNLCAMFTHLRRKRRHGGNKPSYSMVIVQRNIITTVSAYSVVLQCLAKVL